MEFNFEDGERIVKSLTRKVMSALGKFSVSPKKSENARAAKNVMAFTNDITAEDEESFAIVYESIPYKSCETTTEKLFGKVKRSVELKNVPKQDNICCKKTTKHSPTCSNYSTRKLLDETVNKSHDLNVSSESLSSSSSYSMCFLNKSRAKLLETGLGLSESLRKLYLNCSSDSQNSMASSYQRPLTKGSYNKYSSVRDVSQSYNQSEIFRVGSDTESSTSLPSFNLSSCSADSYQGSVNIRYDTSSDDTSFMSDIKNPGPQNLPSFDEKSCTSELNETESPTTRLSCFRDQFSISDLNEPEAPHITSSFTEEFKHDIEYLAKSTFRTSTPDPETRLAAESSTTRTSSRVDTSESSRNFSAKSFMSVTDSSALVSRKRFVHGLSPLCGARSSARDGISSSRAHVRRSLAFLSPCKHTVNIAPKSESGKGTNFSVESKTQSQSANITPDLLNFQHDTFSRDSVLPKIMFQDETEEAVYYLITKYLDNSQCRW
ncbi:uncharacterized protein LOC123562576 [Mercenaria mercenaria]|uniref:uncharacterized protein LOC123562576 n=1 Tax=Mercenaria mercenaria TaxID=6596 RepID=UPI00234E3765|nr:uncharacterized protein LOC123562576 [Mercenaria mercenaria]